MGIRTKWRMMRSSFRLGDLLACVSMLQGDKWGHIHRHGTVSCVMQRIGGTEGCTLPQRDWSSARGTVLSRVVQFVNKHLFKNRRSICTRQMASWTYDNRR